MESIQEITKFAIAIVSIINPIGAIPVFLSLTVDHSNEEIKIIARTCAIAIFITICTSLLAGQYILEVFGITIDSFRIGGGILIGMNAINMIRGQRNESKLNKKEILKTKEDLSELGIVPLAIPLLAGPGAISTSIIYSERLHGTVSWSGAIISLLLISVITYLSLSFSRTISARVGRIGVNVMTRIMGLILMAIGVEFVTGGIKQIFSN